ncbi:MAG: hypothetical protein HYV20_14575, partial [Gemmatimonadetes bacterium]|nr:hypothetical protein [Gemmatimonadota bacterium]
MGSAKESLGMRVSASHAALTVAMIGCVAAACAGTRTGRSGVSNPNLISLTEIDQAREDGVRDLYELIDRARPRWLIGRNPRSLQLQTVIAVYHH